MGLVVLILISLALLAAEALLSALETAVMLLPAGRVHRLLESRVKGSAALDELVEHRHRLRSVSALTAGVTTAALALTGYLAGLDVAASLRGDTSGIGLEVVVLVCGAFGVLLGVALSFSLGQSLPRSLAVSNPERIALDGSSVGAWLNRFVYPLARVLGGPWRWFVEVAAKERSITPWAVTPEFRGATAGEEAEREEAEEALLDAVSDFAEKVAREVMVPRTDVAALPDTATAEEAMSAIHKTGFSRLPIFHESIDDIVGVLYAKDLLVAMGKGGPIEIKKIARKPFYVPEMKPVTELLPEMRVKTHIAVVADEYGGTSGIVTLEDLLEEIVGDISDEYDRVEPLLVDLGGGAFRVDARLPVDDLNEAFGTDLDTEADSVGGLFTELAGRIPELGESFDVEGLRFTVTERQGTRIQMLKVEPVDRVEGETRA